MACRLEASAREPERSGGGWRRNGEAVGVLGVGVDSWQELGGDVEMKRRYVRRGGQMEPRALQFGLGLGLGLARWSHVRSNLGLRFWGFDLGLQFGASIQFGSQFGGSIWGINLGRQFGASIWGLHFEAAACAQDFGSAEDFAGLLARDQPKAIGKEIQRADKRVECKEDETQLQSRGFVAGRGEGCRGCG